MDLSKPKMPNEDEEDNAISTFEEDDYQNRNTGRNSSGNVPAFKDQSPRLHRSSSNALFSVNVVLLIPILILMKN